MPHIIVIEINIFFLIRFVARFDIINLIRPQLQVRSVMVEPALVHRVGGSEPLPALEWLVKVGSFPGSEVLMVPEAEQTRLPVEL